MMKNFALTAALFVAASLYAARVEAAPLFPDRPTEAQTIQVAEQAPVQPKPAAKPKKPAAPDTSKMRPLKVHATAYALRGRTAHGTYVAPGTIAVDPRIIPLGTRMYVPGYGWGKALDTGGAIKGNVIDLWMPSVRQCFAWGVRTVQIFVDHPQSRQGRRADTRLASRGGRKKPAAVGAGLKPATLMQKGGPLAPPQSLIEKTGQPAKAQPLIEKSGAKAQPLIEKPQPLKSLNK